jgi:hypothetical protein
MFLYTIYTSYAFCNDSISDLGPPTAGDTLVRRIIFGGLQVSLCLTIVATDLGPLYTELALLILLALLERLRILPPK